MPESPSWPQCEEMRRECRDGIFRKMDEQHAETLTAIRGLGESVAEIRGARTAEAEARESTALRPAVVRGLTGRELVLIIGAIGALVTGVIVALVSKGGG